MMVMAKSIRMVYSAGPISRAYCAIGSATKISRIVANMQPNMEENRAVLTALVAWPFWAMAYPSMTVALAAVVPGVASRMAEILPPKQPPLKAPRHMTMACVGVR